MNTIIRTHVKNDERLKTLERELKSWYDKEMYQLGDLFIVDDGSPCGEDVNRLALVYNAHYSKTQGEPDTKNGLYWSLKVQDKFPALLCVDDAVFGKGIVDRLKELENRELSILGSNWGIVGLFACYEDNTRKPNRVIGADLWEVKPIILYALVSHVFSKNFARIMIDQWEDVQRGEEPYPNSCDDIWVARTLPRFGYKSYNTMKDYAQHTGINNRTFGDNKGSEYHTLMFVGE